MSLPSESSPAPVSGRGKVAIITGADSPAGLGFAAARRLASSRAYRALYICDIVDNSLADNAEQLVRVGSKDHDGSSSSSSSSSSEQDKLEVHVAKFDASDDDAVKQVVEDAVTRYGRLDVYYANAGIVGPMKTLFELTATDYMNVMRINSLR